MGDFYLDYSKTPIDDAYIIISNVRIHNTSDENITPSRHIPIDVSKVEAKAREEVIFDYFPEFEDNLAPGESIMGDLITHAR